MKFTNIFVVICIWDFDISHSWSFKIWLNTISGSKGARGQLPPGSAPRGCKIGHHNSLILHFYSPLLIEIINCAPKYKSWHKLHTCTCTLILQLRIYQTGIGRQDLNVHVRVCVCTKLCGKGREQRTRCYTGFLKIINSGNFWK